MTHVAPLLRVPDGWTVPLAPLFAGSELSGLRHFLCTELAAGKTIYPRPDEWLRALELTPLDAVRVVILGQDPYHGLGQAHGLAFSVQPGMRVPPSLKNIYKELGTDLGIPPARHGCLAHWASQGVLLLNSVLSVAAGQAASHQGKGWEAMTDAVIAVVTARQRPAVFILWGAQAQKKAAHVNPERHLVLRAPHPSPLSAYTGFFGSRPFSRTNAFLAAHGLPPIDWALPEIP